MTEMINQIKKESKAMNITLWVFQILGAGMFLLSGFLKLYGSDQMVQIFAAIGFGQWFRYLTGALEVIGGIALLIPNTALYAALLLATVMVGGVIAHSALIGGSAVPALILLFAMSFIAWGRFQ